MSTKVQVAYSTNKLIKSILNIIELDAGDNMNVEIQSRYVQKKLSAEVWNVYVQIQEESNFNFISEIFPWKIIQN